VRQLRISRELALPVEAVTESIALLAKRGAGKTYAASVLVEEMLKAKLQVVVLDPMHAWWGLRSSSDGEGEGLPIAILGGPKGDVPLEPTGGSLVADLIVDERLSAILDLSPFSKTERRRFVADFLERLFQRNRDAMHVVLEEADLFAPEGKLKRTGDEQMLGAVYDLVRRGRGRGIGSTLITQRSASLSKEVLTQAEILIALRTTGPQDVAAIKEWIRYHGSEEERDLVLASLHELPTGEAFAWWPVEGILKRIRIRKRETFDSSATPKPGQAQREPKTVADVDLAALSERMAATIERAKAEDPRELRRHIAELQRGIRDLERRSPVTAVETVVETVVERIEVPVLNGQLEQLERAIASMRELAGDHLPLGEALIASGEIIRASAETIAGAIRDSKGVRHEEGARRERASAPQHRREPRADQADARRPASRSRAQAPVAVEGEFRVSGPQQKILDALAWFEAVGLEGPRRAPLAGVAGVKSTSGGFRANISTLSGAGLIEYPEPGRVGLTEAGRSLATPSDMPLTEEGLQEAVYATVSGPQAAILRELVAAYPDALSRDALAGRVGVEPTSGGFRANVSTLSGLEVIGYPTPGYVAALPVLFLEEALV